MPTVFRPNRLACYDDVSILGEIQRVVNQHFGGTPPPARDFDKFSMVRSWKIRRCFGSWASAIRIAGFEYEGRSYEKLDMRRANYTDEMMISDLQRIKELNGGRYFSQSFYQGNGGKYTTKTLKQHFNCSWETLLHERLSLATPVTVRLRLHQPKARFSDEELFLELRRIWEELDRRPSYSEFKQLSPIGVRRYEKRFGDWGSAITWFFVQAGYRSIGLSGSRATPELLSIELERLASNAGELILTFKKYRELGGSYSIGVFQKHFGSWHEAVRHIGHRDGHSGKYTDEELFFEMQCLWETSGRQPTYKDMNRDGLISGGVFQKRFGSWMKAVHAFCADRLSPTEEESEIERERVDHIDLSSESVSIPMPPPALDTCTPNTPKIILVDARRTPGSKLRWRVFQRDRFQCVACGRNPKTHPGVVLEPDHIFPWSRGGLTVFENLQLLCKDCNRGKSDLLPDENSEGT